MKKTLIALALTALPVASMADVILYGQVKAGVEVSKTKGVKGTTTQMADYASRIGFRGAEHLNGDLNAIWQVESRFDVAGGKERTIGTRDTFIGLSSKSLGTVKAGHQQTPIAQVQDRFDLWQYANDANGLGTLTRGTEVNGRKLGVSYTSPELYGVTATAFVSPSESGGESSFYRSKADSTVYGVGFSYENAGYVADLAIGASRGTDVATAANKDFGAQGVVNVGYQANNWLVGATYQVSHNAEKVGSEIVGLNGAARVQEVALTGAYDVSDALRVKASAAHGFKIKDVSGATLKNGKYFQGVVGADYALSKRTTANAQVGHLTSGKKGVRFAETTGSVGLRHRF